MTTITDPVAAIAAEMATGGIHILAGRGGSGKSTIARRVVDRLHDVYDVERTVVLLSDPTAALVAPWALAPRGTYLLDAQGVPPLTTEPGAESLRLMLSLAAGSVTQKIAAVIVDPAEPLKALTARTPAQIVAFIEQVRPILNEFSASLLVVQNLTRGGALPGSEHARNTADTVWRIELDGTISQLKAR